MVIELRRLPQIMCWFWLDVRSIKVTHNSSHFTPRELAALFSQNLFETAEHLLFATFRPTRAPPSKTRHAPRLWEARLVAASSQVR